MKVRKMCTGFFRRGQTHGSRAVVFDFSPAWGHSNRKAGGGKVSEVSLQVAVVRGKMQGL